MADTNVNASPAPMRGALATLALALVVAAAVIALALLMRALLPGKSEELPDFSAIQLTGQTTLQEAAAQVKPLLHSEPELAPKLVGKALGVQVAAQPQATIASLGLDAGEARGKIVKALALRAERQSKDFGRILLKFALWIALLQIPLLLLMRRRLTPAWRYGLLSGAVAVFGIWLGSDPNPMGTVKDAIVLAGQTGALFPPRLIALGVFLLLVVYANKFICSWGCQLGTLQELMYRLNRRGQKHTGALPLIRIPFKVANTIRTITLAALTMAAFAWGFDLLGPIDPFRVYKPAVLGWLGGGFLALVLIAALFTYRPWCTLMCPFGIIGWLAERLSFFKVRVDYEKCIACRACTKACPTQAMEGILLKRGLPQDCFACGDCLPACPTDAVQFTRPGVIKHSGKEADVLGKLTGKSA